MGLRLKYSSNDLKVVPCIYMGRISKLTEYYFGTSNSFKYSSRNDKCLLWIGSSYST
jgi:hypothetical protein